MSNDYFVNFVHHPAPYVVAAAVFLLGCIVVSSANAGRRKR